MYFGAAFCILDCTSTGARGEKKLRMIYIVQSHKAYN
jgi:hypothetical protein